MPNDRVIKIGSGLKDKDRENPPKIGSIVTYKFNGLTKNSLPRFPVFFTYKGLKFLTLFSFSDIIPTFFGV